MRFLFLLVIQFYSHGAYHDTEKHAQEGITYSDISPDTKFNQTPFSFSQLAEEVLNDDDDHGSSSTLLRTDYNSCTHYNYSKAIIKTCSTLVLRKYILFMNLRI